MPAKDDLEKLNRSQRKLNKDIVDTLGNLELMLHEAKTLSWSLSPLARTSVPVLTKPNEYLALLAQLRVLLERALEDPKLSQYAYIQAFKGQMYAFQGL